jgi:hypothetical protein
LFRLLAAVTGLTDQKLATQHTSACWVASLLIAGQFAGA